jgi:alpha-1,2-mannosyltransferase
MRWIVLAQIAALGAVIAIGLWQGAIGCPTGLDALHDWLTFTAYNDSWRPMREAFRWFSEPHHGTIYQEIFFNRHVKFQYPPSSLLLFALPRRIGIPTTDFDLNMICWGAVLVEALAVSAIFWLAARRSTARDAQRGMIVAGAVLAAAMTIFFYPVVRAYSLGQIQAWLNAAFAVAALAYMTGRRGLAGALIGGICLIKPQFGLFLLWALVRRQSRFVIAMLSVLAVGMTLSLMRFGWENHTDYLRAVAYLGRHGEAFYANQSVNGLMQRLLGNGEVLEWQYFTFPPLNKAVYAITLISSLAILGWSFLWRRTGDMADFLLAALAFTIASPIAWEHHYGVLPPIMALLMPAMLLRRPSDAIPWAPILLGFAYVVSASLVIMPGSETTARGVASLAFSGLLYAGLATMLLLSRFAGEIAAFDQTSARPEPA